MRKADEEEKNACLLPCTQWLAAISGHLSRHACRTRHNLRMTTNQELPDEVLSAMAIEWRRKALEGELHARGIAHELETELRRRAGVPFTNYDTLDLRPLETRSMPRRWWMLWRGS